jgi:hypothetical protein
MALTVEEAKKEIEKITPEIERLRKLSDRLILLRNFVALGEQLGGGMVEPLDFSDYKVEILTEGTRESPNQKRGGRTAGLAQEILSAVHSPLHVMDIVKAARLKGWGTGDDLADEGSMYAALHRYPNRFVSMGKKMWRLPARSPRPDPEESKTAT